MLQESQIAVSLQDVSFLIQENTRLNDANLDVHQGEICALIAITELVNLRRIVVGELEPTSGKSLLERLDSVLKTGARLCVPQLPSESYRFPASVVEPVDASQYAVPKGEDERKRASCERTLRHLTL